MKIADDEYVEWCTITNSPRGPILDRDDAVEEHGADRVRWVDEHLCSCRARLGERPVKRNGRYVMVGGGPLAYAFDSYSEVLEYMVGSERLIKTEADLRAHCETLA